MAGNEKNSNSLTIRKETFISKIINFFKNIFVKDKNINNKDLDNKNVYTTNVNINNVSSKDVNNKNVYTTNININNISSKYVNNNNVYTTNINSKDEKSKNDTKIDHLNSNFVIVPENMRVYNNNAINFNSNSLASQNNTHNIYNNNETHSNSNFAIAPKNAPIEKITFTDEEIDAIYAGTYINKNFDGHNENNSLFNNSVNYAAEKKRFFDVFNKYMDGSLDIKYISSFDLYRINKLLEEELKITEKKSQTPINYRED